MNQMSQAVEDNTHVVSVSFTKDNAEPTWRIVVFERLTNVTEGTQLLETTADWSHQGEISNQELESIRALLTQYKANGLFEKVKHVIQKTQRLWKHE